MTLWVGACQSKPAAVPGYTAPHLTRETIAPEFLFQTLASRRAGLIDLKSLVRATVTKNKKSQSFKQALLVRGDDALRLDTLDIFGRPRGVFIHDNSETLLYDIGQNRMYRGREAWDVMEKIIGAVGDFNEYISLLSGNIPRLNTLKLVSGRLGFEKKLYKLDTLDPSGRIRFLIDMDAFTLNPVKLVKEVDFQDVYSVRWEDYKKLGDYYFPHRIVVTRPDGELVIKYRKPVINSGITRESFRFTPPSGRSNNS